MTNYEDDMEYELPDGELTNMILKELANLLPKEYVTVINPPRYLEALKTVEKLTKLFENDAHMIVDTYLDPLVGTSLCVSIQTNMISITKMDAFCEALSHADTFSIDALTNRDFEIGLTFEDVAIPISK